MIDLREVLRLAIEALPSRRVHPSALLSRVEGSLRQEAAENAFYDALSRFLAQCGTVDAEQTWTAFETYCLKATAAERIKEGVRIAVEVDRE